MIYTLLENSVREEGDNLPFKIKDVAFRLYSAVIVTEHGSLYTFEDNVYNDVMIQVKLEFVVSRIEFYDRDIVLLSDDT